nr:RNA polymerase sigma factor [bacterium]
MRALLVASPVETSAQQMDECLGRIAQGDLSALETLYHQTKSAVYGFALSILKDVSDAEEVMQDVYLRVYSGAVGYQPQGKPMAWLLTITRHLALTTLRKRGNVISLVEQDARSAFADAPGEDGLLLQAALRLLKDQERQVVMLHAVAGLKHREIAALLELPLPTVLSKYQRSLAKLRTYLTQGEGQA